MRIVLLAAVSSAGLLFSSLAFADDARPVTPTPASTDDSSRVVCRAIYHEGSIVHRSQCLTQREWDRRRYEDQQWLRQYVLQ